jgi:uncharacterized protein YcbK (DUF882 family)
VSASTRSLAQARYREWLGDHVQARFGFADEIARLADNVRNGVRNSTPPVELWAAIVPTLRVVERVRDRFGPTTLNSAYRDRLYNTAVTKKPLSQSQHIQNTAIDFRCRTGTPAEWTAFLRELRSQGVFSGGIGTYPSGFVHIDTRGTNADWTG